MASVIGGTVLMLNKIDRYYRVTVEIENYSGFLFNVDIDTGMTDPARAIEIARTKLHEIGAGMVDAFAKEGSLQ